MQNIIKALKYKVARDNVTYYALIGAAVFLALDFTENKNILSYTASEYFLAPHIYVLAIGAIFALLPQESAAGTMRIRQ